MTTPALAPAPAPAPASTPDRVPAPAPMFVPFRSGLGIALDAARALVPVPASPPDLCFSFLNPVRFPKLPSMKLRRYVAWLLREAEVPAFPWGPEITRIYGSENKFQVSISKHFLSLHIVSPLSAANIITCTVPPLGGKG